jgi:hypothetical protein
VWRRHLRQQANRVGDRLKVVEFLAAFQAGFEVVLDLKPLRRRELVVNVSRKLLSQASVPALKDAQRHACSIYSPNAAIRSAAVLRRLGLLFIFMT